MFQLKSAGRVLLSVLIVVCLCSLVLGAKTTKTAKISKASPAERKVVSPPATKAKKMSNRGIELVRIFGDEDAIRIIDPPAFRGKPKAMETVSSSSRASSKAARAERLIAPKSSTSADRVSHKPVEVILGHRPRQFQKHRPSILFPGKTATTKEKAELTRTIRQPPTPYQKPVKIDKLSTKLTNSPTSPWDQIFPYMVSAAVRHKNTVRGRNAASSTPHVKQRVQTKNLNTYQSKKVLDSFDYEEDIEDTKLGVPRSRRLKRDIDPLIDTAITENSTTASEEISSDDDSLHEDPHLNEGELDFKVKDSLNATDPAALTMLHTKTLESILTNVYINEYLNCIDRSTVVNELEALQTKIDCMKRKLFEKTHFDPTGSSRYSISDLPAALVYADVMGTIKKLARPNNGIAFYSLPLDKVAHLQTVLLPVEEYVSQVYKAHFTPRNPHNRKLYFNENLSGTLPIWYIQLQPSDGDGGIYPAAPEPVESQTRKPAEIFHAFPDIPNADDYIESGSDDDYL